MCALKKRRALFTGALGIVFSFVSAWFAHADDAVFSDIETRFEARKPTVQMEYRVGYRFLHLELKRIAEATVLATEGVWRDPQGRNERTACLVDFRLDTSDAADTPEARRGSVSIHNRIVSVLTVPDLNAIVYAKRTNQRIHVFRRRSEMDNVELFDLEGGSLRYSGHNYLTGSDQTDLAGRTEIARQGKEVCRFVQCIAAAYCSDAAHAAEDPREPVYIFTGGSLVPYAIRFKEGREKVSVLDRLIPSLHVHAQPKATSAGRTKGNDFEMWTASFVDVSKTIRQPELIALAQDSVSFSMVPLITDLGLPLGAIRGILTGIRIAETGKPDRGDVAHKAPAPGKPSS